MSDGNTSPENAEQGPLSIDSAAQRLAGSTLDSEENAAPIDPESEPSDEAPEEEAEIEAATEEEGGEYEVDEESDNEAEEPVFDINGEQVTLENVGKGYLRQSDYTQKTQNLASEFKKIEAERASIAAERQHLKQMLEVSQTDATPEPDWVQLAEDDPLEYTRKRAVFDADKAVREAKQAEAHRLGGVQRQEQAVHMQQYLVEQNELLAQKIPAMAGENAGQYQAGIRTFMQGLGYSNEELSQIYDHRTVAAFDALREKEGMKSNKAVASKKVKGKMKVLKPGVRKTKNMATAKQAQQAKARLRKSGSVNDAVALLLG